MKTRSNGVYKAGFYCMKNYNFDSETHSSIVKKSNVDLIGNFLINLKKEIIIIKKRV